MTVAGLTVNTQTLGSATQYSEYVTYPTFRPLTYPPMQQPLIIFSLCSSLSQGVNDGLMGLAFPAISSYPATPFFNNLIENNAVDAGQFGFYLASEGSTLYLGGSDKAAYTGDINWNPVTEEVCSTFSPLPSFYLANDIRHSPLQGYWQIDMDSISVGDKEAVSKLSVIVDSGTTLIIGDAANVKGFWAAVPHSADASQTAGEGFYTFPCDSKVDASVTFGGKSYTISPENLNLGTVSEGSSDCVGSIVAGKEDFWIMGDAFMKNVYAVFDFDNTRVGFASLASSKSA